MRGETAWLMAKASTEKLVEELEPQMQYAVRRVGGYDGLARQRDFTQAWNEAPIVDADLDTHPGKILVRPLERKDGLP